MKIEDMLQKDPFGEKLLSVAGHDMNQTQIEKFQLRINQMIEQANREAGFYAAAEKKKQPPKKQPKADEAEQVDAGEYMMKRFKRFIGDAGENEEEEPEEEEFSSYNVSYLFFIKIHLTLKLSDLLQLRGT